MQLEQWKEPEVDVEIISKTINEVPHPACAGLSLDKGRRVL
jgi:hypothetical protein